MVHLHRHSEYSLPDGTGTADRWAKEAKRIGHNALAITDHGTIGGALHHIKACRDEGIYPIVGVEAYFRPDRTLKNDENKKAYHLTLHAANLKGWHNLIKLTTEAFLTGYYRKPCLDLELLRQHSDGIICTTACVNSYLNQKILAGDDQGAQEHLSTLQGIFKDKLWIEIMPHDFDEQRYINLMLTNLGYDHGIGLITTVDAHYPYKEWAKTQDIRLMCATGQSRLSREEQAANNEEAFSSELGTLYLSTEDEVKQMYKDFHPDMPEDIVVESINNTHELVRQTNFYMINRDNKLPKVSESYEESERIIRQWCEEGFERISPRGNNDEYRNRYEYELGVLKDNGVLDYFVLVGDMVKWARSQGIRVGPGRGSAAGCLVSYLIGITAIDPIGYELLFERFLNPTRKGLPDIDIDFDADRRDEVKQYLQDKYGQDHVVDIAAYSTFGARAAIQEVAKRFNIPESEWKKATDPIGTLDSGITKLAKGYEPLDEFRKKYPEVWLHAERLEGQVKNVGTHAAGVVITDKPVTDYMPLIYNNGTDKKIVTGWSDSSDYTIISDFGFIKIDFLGLTNLSKQEYAVNLINDRKHEYIDLEGLDVMHDPLAVDPEVMKNFSKGLTLGVFQFGGRGITQLLRHIKPDNIHDIAVANALYRPGPIKQANKFGDIKKGTKPEVYPHDSVKPVLKKTLGIIAFQEQVMQITQILGGFSGGEADDMRKAMGKLYRQGGDKAQQFMAQYKPKFFEGCREKGLEEKEAEVIWENILEFGDYAFNASHSYSYAVQAYWDELLKTDNSPENYAALLTYDPDLAESAVRESRGFDVEINPPDINKSGSGFTLLGDELIFSLIAVKHVGPRHISKIVKNRPYDDFEDFCRANATLDKGAKISLISAGAFDKIDSREELLAQVPMHKKEETWTVAEHIHHNVKNLKKERPIPTEKTYPSQNELKMREKEALGVSLTIPGIVVEYADYIEERIYTQDEVEALSKGDKVYIGGEISGFKEHTIKGGKMKGQKMAFMDLAFKDSTWSCIMFPGTYKHYKDKIETGAVMVKGKKDNKEGVIVDALKPIEEMVKEDGKD